MAKGARKGGRVRDKWRDKQWIIVNKPSGFEPQVPINYIPVTDPTQIKGRTIENTLHDMMKGNPDQSMDQHQIKVFIQIDKVTDGVATSIFKGQKILSERIPQMTVDQFIQEITGSKGEDIPRETNSKLGGNVLGEAKKITAIRHLGIRKTKLVSTAESRAVSEAKTIESAAPAQ